MHTITIDGNSHSYPSSWDELSNKQLMFVVGRFLNSDSASSIKLRSILKFIDLTIVKSKPFIKKGETLHLYKNKKNNPVFLSHEQLAAMVQTLDFLFRSQSDDFGNSQTVLDSHLTKNIIPSFKLRGTTYHGPSDKLFNLTFKEFIVAETAFQKYAVSSSAKDLSFLIATLYRPSIKGVKETDADFSGDLREPFNDFIIEHRAIQLLKMDSTLQFCIALYYQGCRKFLHKHFPNVFSGSKGKPNSDDKGFLNLVDSLTSGDVTKTEEVRNSMLFDILVHLEKTAKDALNTKSNTK